MYCSTLTCTLSSFDFKYHFSLWAKLGISRIWISMYCTVYMYAYSQYNIALNQYYCTLLISYYI